MPRTFDVIWREAAKEIAVESEAVNNPSSRFYGMKRLYALSLGLLSSITSVDIIEAKKALKEEGYVEESLIVKPRKS